MLHRAHQSRLFVKILRETHPPLSQIRNCCLAWIIQPFTWSVCYKQMNMLLLTTSGQSRQHNDKLKWLSCNTPNHFVKIWSDSMCDWEMNNAMIIWSHFLHVITQSHPPSCLFGQCQLSSEPREKKKKKKFIYKKKQHHSAKSTIISFNNSLSGSDPVNPESKRHVLIEDLHTSPHAHTPVCNCPSGKIWHLPCTQAMKTETHRAISSEQQPIHFLNTIKALTNGSLPWLTKRIWSGEGVR